MCIPIAFNGEIKLILIALATVGTKMLQEHFTLINSVRSFFERRYDLGLCAYRPGLNAETTERKSRGAIAEMFIAARRSLRCISPRFQR